jgi:hypothetical protein
VDPSGFLQEGKNCPKNEKEPKKELKVFEASPGAWDLLWKLRKKILQYIFLKFELMSTLIKFFDHLKPGSGFTKRTGS